MQNTPNDLHERFTWEADGRWETYHVLADNGPVKGDCDDWAMTVAWAIARRSRMRFFWHIVTFQTVFWLVRDPTGGSHMSVWINGYGWSDNWNDSFNDTPKPHKKRFPVAWPVVLFKLALGKFIERPN